MKKILLIAVMATSSLIAGAQTKETNTLGLGIGFLSQTNEVSNQAGTQSDKQKSRFFSLGYGRFIKDNERLGISLSYGNTDYTYSQRNQTFNQKLYGGILSYQKYYPLIKKLYAFGGGRAGYNYAQTDDSLSEQINSSNTYSLGGYGGLTWFLSKRFAFETDLLAADISYNKVRNDASNSNNSFNSTTTSFNLSTSGAISNLGFKIYFLF